LTKFQCTCNTAQCNVVAVVMVRAVATAYRRGEKEQSTWKKEKPPNQQSTVGDRSNNQQQTMPTTESQDEK